MIEIENPLEAFSEFPGPILLLAGPGTGKTYQIEKRIEYIVNKLNANPEEIAVITFTVAAARNMRNRLASKNHNLPPEKTPQIINTMHSLGNSLIGEATSFFGLPNDYGVLTDRYHLEVIMQDAAKLVDVDNKIWGNTIKCRGKGACDRDENDTKCRICQKYEEILRKCGLIDYDDQIFLACRLLRENEEIASRIRKDVKYLLVDEYQDINQAQCEFIQLLSKGQNEGLFVVGDDDQSIYSFRGGDPKFICDFEKYYGKSTKIGRLSVSFRCPENILVGARTIVEKFYPKRAFKPDLTFSEDIKINNKIVLYDFPSEKFEALKIASISEEAVKQRRKVIIIIPTKNYFPIIRDALIRKGINYSYKADPSKDGLIRFAVMSRWVRQKQDNALLRYLLHLIVYNNDAVVKEMPLSSLKITEKRNELASYLATLWSEVNQNNDLYSEICKRSNDAERFPFENILKTRCLDLIEKYVEGDICGRRKALPDFLGASGLMVAPGKNPKGFIKEIDNWMIDVKGSGMGGAYAPVELYNMPSSKGLQAEVVCVVGLSKGLFPTDKDDIPEKSRLAYVAMTRAKEELYLFSCRTRPAEITYEKISYSLEPSPFLDVINEKHMEIRRKYYKTRSAGKKKA
jgi:DNA helicase-2/ATP-dependent DNA helicase PcrA